jgi:hypothetical protein
VSIDGSDVDLHDSLASILRDDPAVRRHLACGVAELQRGERCCNAS